jgi:hypothetical protein
VARIIEYYFDGSGVLERLSLNKLMLFGSHPEWHLNLQPLVVRLGDLRGQKSVHRCKPF